MPKCAFCHKEVEIRGHLGFRETCPHCGRDLHSCLQCEFYEENAPHQCREPGSELIENKESANYCDLFRFGRKTGEEDKDERERAKKALEELFKK